MCAMIPMFRVLARIALLATAAALFFPLEGTALGTCLSEVPGSPAGCRGLPAVVREGLVRLGHLVGVLAALDAGAEAVAGVEELVHQALGHRLLAAGAGVLDEPAQRERGAAAGAHLDRH